MASVYSKDLQVYTAEAFKHDIANTETNIYLTIGRISSWPNDAAPPQTNTSVTVFNEIFKNMIGAKLITGNDVYHVIPRIDWAANTSYAAYDHCTCSLQLFDYPNIKFYIVTSDWNVYKCLSNNNGAVSTVMPTSTLTTGTITTADNYIWKYMYTISPAEQLKFTTPEYIPVKTLKINDNSLQWLVQNNAVSGAVNAVKMVNLGSNYTIANITWSGDGTSFNAYPVVNTSTGNVTSIVIDDPGRDYTYLDITITGNGTNASARAMISPPGGHGSDPLYELGGSYLMLNPRIKGSEGGYLPITNDFRQIAMIKDPKQRISGNLFSNTIASQTTTITVTGVSDTQFQKDEIVYQGVSYATATFTGVVLDWNTTDSPNKLVLTNTTGTPTEKTIIGLTSGAQRFPSSFTFPELRNYSGKLIYTDNLLPVARASDQTEDFKVIIKF